MAGKRNSGTLVWREVAAVATRQAGMISRQQLRAIGFADSGIDDAVAKGHLHPVFRAVFGVGHRGITEQARLLAATMACGPESVVSHGNLSESGYAVARLGWEELRDRPEATMAELIRLFHTPR